jgi:imidazoleglycerol-phosphate dehydratase
MLEQVARHSLIDITVDAKGDLHIDFSTTPSRTSASRSARRCDRRSATEGHRRYADVHLPMDER